MIEYIAVAKYNTTHLRNTVKIRNGRATVKVSMGFESDTKCLILCSITLEQ
jgi:hypothetical protein